MYQKQFKITKKASSLVEVLVILAIISTSIVASTSLAVNSQKKVIENQREDTANGILVQALEVSKSPSLISLGEEIDFVADRTYYFRFTEENQRLVLAQAPTALTSCEQGSLYQVETFGNTEEINFPMCIGVEVKYIQPLRSTKAYYELTVRAIFQQGKQLRFLVLKGVRSEAFTN